MIRFYYRGDIKKTEIISFQRGTKNIRPASQEVLRWRRGVNLIPERTILLVSTRAYKIKRSAAFHLH